MSAALTVAGLNDLFRETFLTGRVVLTDGIASLPDDLREAVITRVRTFDAFSPDDDPYGEHDCGAFDQPGVGKVFWKIDCYDPEYRHRNEDPADPKVTRRVLTIMLAEEY